MFCQNTENFIRSDFSKGLPNGINFKWENCLYVSIDGGEFFKNINIISRDSLKTADQLLLAPISENGFYFTRIPFEKVTQNIYKGSILLKNIYEDELSPLSVKIDLAERMLYYRWENHDKQNYKIPTIIKEYPLKVGETFPIIKVETQKGDWTNENSKKIILINWWATSCLPCIEEMPGLNKLVKKYKNEKVEFISIVWDTDNLEEFLSKNSFLYSHGFGNEYLTKLFGETFPRNLIITFKLRC